jgi:hypothetical protein
MTYNDIMKKGDHDEITCYANPKTVCASAGLLFILAIAGLSEGFGGGVFADLSVAFSILLAAVAAWITLHPKSYISVDKTDGVFRSRVFGFASREIPISAITHIGTRGTFLGAMSIMTITYRKSDGKTVTVRSISKQSYDKASFRNVMNAITELNPKLTIPTELEG